MKLIKKYITKCKYKKKFAENQIYSAYGKSLIF